MHYRILFVPSPSYHSQKCLRTLCQKSSNRNGGKFVIGEKYQFRVFSYIFESNLNSFQGISSCPNTIYLKIHICSKFLRYQFCHGLNFYMNLIYFCIIYSVPCICKLVCQHYTVLIKECFTKLKYLIRLASPPAFIFQRFLAFFRCCCLFGIIPHKNY